MPLRVVMLWPGQAHGVVGGGLCVAGWGEGGEGQFCGVLRIETRTLPKPLFCYCHIKVTITIEKSPAVR